MLVLSYVKQQQNIKLLPGVLLFRTLCEKTAERNLARERKRLGARRERTPGANLTKGRGIPSDWSILTGFVNSRAIRLRVVGFCS